MKGYVYLIKCPISLNVVYIGVTYNVTYRYISHCNGYTPVSIWAKSIRPLKPIMEIVFEGDYGRACSEEGTLIKQYRNKNFILFNRKLGTKYSFKPNSSKVTATKRLTPPIIKD